MRHIITTFIALLSVAVVSGRNAAQTEFEVATVKPSPPVPPRLIPGTLGQPGHWQAARIPLVKLIESAYPAYGFDALVVGGPEWIRDPKTIWDIDARMDPKTPRDQVAPMVAHLLADRFGLRFHTGPRMVSVYLLKLSRADGQLGPKLKRSAEACVAARMARQALPIECRGTPGTGLNMTINQISELLQYFSFRGLDRPVLDRTGLQGYYDLQLAYDCDTFAPLAPGVPTRPCAPDGVSMFTALQEQAGLKLEPSREMVDVMVIDSVRMPDPD